MVTPHYICQPLIERQSPTQTSHSTSIASTANLVTAHLACIVWFGICMLIWSPFFVVVKRACLIARKTLTEVPPRAETRGRLLCLKLQNTCLVSRLCLTKGKAPHYICRPMIRRQSHTLWRQSWLKLRSRSLRLQPIHPHHLHNLFFIEILFIY